MVFGLPGYTRLTIAITINVPWNAELLVGGFNPFEKNLISQIGSFRQVGMKIRNIWNHQLDY